FVVCSLLLPYPARVALFPYTTLFRSDAASVLDGAGGEIPSARLKAWLVRRALVGDRRLGGTERLLRGRLGRHQRQLSGAALEEQVTFARIGGVLLRQTHDDRSLLETLGQAFGFWSGETEPRHPLA